MKQKILKFYISNEIEENKNEIIQNTANIKTSEPIKNNNSQLINNENANNKIIFQEINSETKKYNNFFKEGKSQVESITSKKKEIKEILNHFASLSYISKNINTGDIINNAIHVSDLMNELHQIEKANEPGKFLDCDSILKYPGLIMSKI